MALRRLSTAASVSSARCGPAALGLRRLAPRPQHLVSTKHLAYRPGPAASLRTFAASASEGDLRAVLKEELAHENDNYEPDEELKDVPGGYAVEDKPGDGQVILTKSMGSEQIAVTFEVNDQPDPEPLGEDVDDVAITRMFAVTITKGSKSLNFECSTDGEGVNIEHMTLEPKDGFDEGSTMYMGPVYYELDEKVQEKASAYLSERHIYDLGPFIFNYIEDKEERLYQGWLSDAVNFLES